MGMWCDSLRRIPPIGFFFVEIRGAGPCWGGAHTLHGCVRWSPIWRMRAWWAWRLPRRWPDRGRGVPSQDGRGDVLLQRMPRYLTIRTIIFFLYILLPSKSAPFKVAGIQWIPKFPIFFKNHGKDYRGKYSRSPHIKMGAFGARPDVQLCMIWRLPLVWWPKVRLLILEMNMKAFSRKLPVKSD